MRKRIVGLVWAAMLVLAALALTFWGAAGPPTRLSIVSGSENRGLESIVQDWARASGTEVSVTYLGSVDISRELEKGTAGGYDAVWPAHSL